MRRTLFLKVFAAAALVSLAAILVFALYAVGMVHQASFGGLAAGLEKVARVVQAVLAQPGMGEPAARARIVSDTAREAGVRLTVIDPRGVVLADSEEDPAKMANHADRPEVARALRGEVGVSERLSTTVNRAMVYVAVPLQEGGAVRDVVRASFPSERFARSERALAGAVLSFALPLIAACALLAFLFSRWLLLPLRDLTAVVQRFSAGDFGARLHLRRRDELRALADSFNAMAERLQALFGEVTRRTEELDGVFSSVAQGIALLDSHEKILRANRGFTEIAGQERVEGKALWEVVRTLPLMELVERVKTRGPQPSEELRIGPRTVLASVSPVAEGRNLILVLHDTTDVRLLEEVKRDFVVNASHELRTPLTAIHGYLEMLQGEVTEGEAARWVEVISRNTERMTAIVEDLLSLAGLEAAGSLPVVEQVPVGRLFADVAELFVPRAQAKGISLSFTPPGGLPTLPADPYLLEQMLINLVDNAIKYTERGSVTVEAAVEEPWMTLRVSDTGIGIPEDHQPRVFERFYVVDKSRSRTMGGTGLGLSIVKHIAQLHGGSIAVESSLGGGTRFTVHLPLHRTPPGN
jgi:two-component system, OmpR family, phosphate regulon sensor histidine kinase PhoR